MPHDPVLVADTRAWPRKAAADLATAEHDLRAVSPLVGDVAFHAQQAAEKTLEAFLAWYDRRFGKTHDLVELGAQCVELDPSRQQLLGATAPLTEYAWKFRYPGEPEGPSEEAARDGLATARATYDGVLQRPAQDVFL